MNKNYDSFLMVSEAARILRISRQALYNRLWKGEFPFVQLAGITSRGRKRAGGRILIEREALEKYLHDARVDR